MSNSRYSACGQTGLIFVNKIIEIVEVALKCSKSQVDKDSLEDEGNSSTLPADNGTVTFIKPDRMFAQKLLDLLNVVKDEVHSQTLLKDEEVVDNFGSLSPEFNSSSNQVELDQILSPTEPSNSRAINKIQNLELIKVAVLIFVISIIMLTTCRMVFQLFVRFRPEKSRV